MRQNSTNPICARDLYKETVSSVMYVMNAINYLLGPRDTETGHRDLVMQYCILAQPNRDI
jgi:hypothetical protein